MTRRIIYEARDIYSVRAPKHSIHPQDVGPDFHFCFPLFFSFDAMISIFLRAEMDCHGPFLASGGTAHARCVQWRESTLLVVGGVSIRFCWIRSKGISLFSGEPCDKRISCEETRNENVLKVV